MTWTMTEKDNEDLGIPAAIWRSLRGKATDFYPRVKDCDEPLRTLRTRAMMDEFSDAAEGWEAIESGDDLDAAIGLARQSLSEVKAQTEYQDQKAGRLLTITTILSALAGLLFQRFSDAYPLLATWQSASPAKWLILFAYLPFVLFSLAVLFGALVTFHATRTRFKYDEEEVADASTDKADATEEKRAKVETKLEAPHSRLFYTGMLRARPRAWAASFVETKRTGDRESLIVSSRLPQLYFRDLVGEAYLVAAKTADKIRFLIEAQRLFAWALVFLLFWLFMFFVVSFVPSTKSAPGATLVRLEQGSGTASPTLVRIDQQRPLEVNASVQSRPQPAGQTGKRPSG